MELTPLRFAKTLSWGESRKPIYGHRYYLTNCGRFVIQYVDGWQILSEHSSWFDWLDAHGIDPYEGKHMPNTRRESLEMLRQLLETEGLIDAAFPTNC